ncbi:MAG: hypothetical protein ACOY33_05460 [Pseudomonadota bacterium]
MAGKLPVKPLALLLLAVLAWGGAHLVRELASRQTGPLAVAAGDDAVFVLAPGVLYRLDTDGRLQETLTGLVAADARDGGLAWIGDALLVSPGTDGALLRCPAAGSACEPFSDDPYTPTGPVQASLAADGRLWLLETAADRAHRFFPDGRRIDMPLSNLRTPGAILQQGEWLHICNAGAGTFEHRRMHRRGVGEPEEPFSRFAAVPEHDPVNRPLRMLPRDDGSFRLILTNAARTQGRLADVDAEGNVRPLTIDDLVNPVSLAALDDDTLVVDEDRMQVLRIDAAGQATSFGDAAFRAALDTGTGLRDALRLADPLLLVLATLLAAGGGSWLLQQLLARPEDPALTVAPGPDGIAWLPAANVRAAQHLATHAVIALPLALVPVLLAAHFRQTVAGLLWAVLVIVVAVVRGRQTTDAGGRSETRIGLRGPVLIVADPEHGMNEYRLSQVRWNESELQPTDKLRIPLVRDGHELFHRPTLENTLFPQLDPRQKSDA